MHLTAVPVTHDFKDMKKLSALAEEAFSEREYISPERAIAMSTQDVGCDFLAIYDDGGADGVPGSEEIFVGFMVVMKFKTMAYLALLAIVPELREHGYGHEALLLLGEEYDLYHLVMDMEMLDAKAGNLEKQKFRRHFYLDNGYRSTGFFATYHGLSYEIFTRTEDFDLDDFEDLILRVKLRLLHDVKETHQRPHRMGDDASEVAVPVQDDEYLPPEIADLDDLDLDGLADDPAYAGVGEDDGLADPLHPAGDGMGPLAAPIASGAGSFEPGAEPIPPAAAPAESQEHRFAFAGEDCGIPDQEDLSAFLENAVAAAAPGAAPAPPAAPAEPEENREASAHSDLADLLESGDDSDEGR